MKMEGTALPGGCDLIVMATHGRQGIQRWALGSVAERVLHGTRLPVMIVRPGESESRAQQHAMPQLEGTTDEGNTP